MAAQRSKNQARRSGRSGTPGWMWLAVGLLIGGRGLRLPAVPGRLGQAGDSLLPTPDPQARAPAPSERQRGARAGRKSRKPKYDFYTLLPEKEVVIPDAELDAQARAEAAQAGAARGAPRPPPRRPRLSGARRPARRRRDAGHGPAAAGCDRGRRRSALPDPGRRLPRQHRSRGAEGADRADRRDRPRRSRADQRQHRAPRAHGAVSRTPARWPPPSRRWPATASPRRRSRSSRQERGMRAS